MPDYVSKAGGVGLAYVLTVDDLGLLTTGSFDSGSLLVTASFANPFLSFSRGDGTQFFINLQTLVPTNASTASFVTASNVWGPYGANSVISASIAVSSSFANTASFTLSSSLAATASFVNLLAGPNITINYQPNGIAITSSGGGGVGTPASPDQGIQYNYGGVFGASVSFKYVYDSESFQQGYLTNAIGLYSHAEGESATAFDDASHAEGVGTQAIAKYSHAEGNRSVAQGESSHAEGWLSVASGSYSHAEGYFTTTTGEYSHAEGKGTIAVGTGSHAEGNGSTANGSFAHAEGDTTQARGNYSNAKGLGTIAYADGQLAVGQYNINSNTVDLFVIGNGTNDDNRSDILNVSLTSVRISGSTNISGSLNLVGNQTITGSLFVGGNITAQQYIISSSVLYVTESNFSGSHVFGNTLDDTHQFTGSVFVTGSATFIGPLYANNVFLTGSLFGTSSWSTQAFTASFVTSSNVYGPFSANSILSASHGVTASYIDGGTF